ncbi:MAG: 7-cyano-7-deazaguanine synthase [Pirellulales bacterium]|nr:7-cyano-7-deazaguanine synthase [Pirellulales bacterium]
MAAETDNATTGVLLSGGLDSSVLLGDLVRRGRPVQPFFIRSGLAWETCELEAVHRFLDAVAAPGLRPLVTLEMPLDDLYGNHWSLTGRDVPNATSPDEAVFLPGRNALLIVKAALWCQLHGINRLALGVLGTSPFTDAAGPFFEHFEAMLRLSGGQPVRLLRPFAAMNKRAVMELGRDLPLEHTFSCIAPVAGQHCGQCNKCAERMEAFRSIALNDPTIYHTTEKVLPAN